MKPYETCATVDQEGRLELAGVPFAAGTQVEVIISPITGAPQLAARSQLLLSALDRGRNTQPLGELKRADLYDRGVLR